MFGLFGNPSPEKFGRMILDAARKAGCKADLTFDAKAFTILVGASGKAFLDNVYKQYCAAKGSHRKKIMENYLSIFDQLTDSASREDAMERCVAAVRETTMFSNLALESGTSGDAPAIRREAISRWLSRLVVLDMPGSMSLVSDTQLKDWELDFDDLYERGLERLRESSPPSFRSANGYFEGTWKDDYDSSRILLPSLFKHLPIDEPIVCTPDRLTLLVADRANTAGVIAMLDEAERLVREATRPMNPAPLAYRGGEVIDFLPEPSCPLFARVTQAHRLAALIYYQGQAEVLQKVHQEQKKDLFVASYKVMERPDGSYLSLTMWIQGVPSLIPEADIVAFVEPGENEKVRVVKQVAWTEVQQSLGDLMLDVQMEPKRYYISKFPSPEQFAGMNHVEL